jgi:hypothetical protein
MAGNASTETRIHKIDTRSPDDRSRAQLTAASMLQLPVCNRAYGFMTGLSDGIFVTQKAKFWSNKEVLVMDT